MKNAWIEICRSLGVVAGTVKGELGSEGSEVNWELQDFFSSYETSYSMTLAYPEDLLLESAKSVGIPIHGRDKLDIVRDMIELQRKQEQDLRHETN